MYITQMELSIEILKDVPPILLSENRLYGYMARLVVIVDNGCSSGLFYPSSASALMAG